MLRRLSKHGIKCSYVLINAASYVMKQVYNKYFNIKISSTYEACSAK